MPWWRTRAVPTGVPSRAERTGSGEEFFPQALGEDSEDGTLRAEVPRVDDVHPLFDGTLRIVILHIARDVDIRAAPYGIVDKVVKKA